MMYEQTRIWHALGRSKSEEGRGEKKKEKDWDSWGE
jgi:hypothetical protein